VNTPFRGGTMYVENRIRVYRAIKGWSQEELAKKIGMAQTTIAKFEQGYSSPKIETAFELANLFGVSVTDLFFEKGKNPPVQIPDRH